VHLYRLPGPHQARKLCFFERIVIFPLRVKFPLQTKTAGKFASRFAFPVRGLAVTTTAATVESTTTTAAVESAAAATTAVSSTTNRATTVATTISATVAASISTAVAATIAVAAPVSIDSAVAVAIAATEPRASSDEEAAIEPGRSVVPIRSAGVRIVVVVAVRASWRTIGIAVIARTTNPDPNRYLGMGVGSGWKNQNT
jgi:hypothetical protein